MQNDALFGLRQKETDVSDVVLHSRVRLARNLDGIPFPSQMRGEDGAKAQYRVAEAIELMPGGNDYALLRIHDLPDWRRRSLCEQHLISRELLSAGEFAAVMLRRDEQISVMLNEDDHIRIIALLPGSQLDEAAQSAFAVDDALGKSLRYAYDAELGFLTACPTNTGTGMRASTLMHLPSLTRSGAVAQVVQELSKLGISLRPMYSDEGEAQGDLYLLGNQVALGRSEEELIDSLEAVVLEIVEREREARELLLLSDDSLLEDRLMRSVGILRYARLLPEGEWMRRWSDARMAVQAGLLHMPLSELDALLSRARPAHLEMELGRELSPMERDSARAGLVREALLMPGGIR